jgi:hypothetical protein
MKFWEAYSITTLFYRVIDSAKVKTYIGLLGDKKVWGSLCFNATQ